MLHTGYFHEAASQITMCTVGSDFSAQKSLLYETVCHAEHNNDSTPGDVMKKILMVAVEAKPYATACYAMPLLRWSTGHRPPA